MVKGLYKIMVLFGTFLAISCGESLEDTYAEYAGDGMIRYVGKCSDTEVHPGWKRLLVTWKGNKNDVMIEHVRVTWKLNDIEHDTLLMPTADTCDLRNLVDGNYEISVCNVDKNGNTSIIESVYGRPYSEVHEDLLTFSRGIISYYKINNSLAMFYDTWNNNVSSILLNYYTNTGELKSFDIRQSMNRGWTTTYLLENVDTDRLLTINRVGKMEGCIDPITFATDTLNDERILSPDFMLLLKNKYGNINVDNQFLNSIEEIEIDYRMETLQDLFYFPNLKKVILGKNRYMHPKYTNEELSTTNIDKGIFTLQSLNKLLGVTVECYNQHYFADGVVNRYNMGHIIKRMSNPVCPDITPLDATGWTVTCSDNVATDIEYNPNVEALLDNKPSTYFEPQIATNMEVYEIIIDMQKEQTVHGFKVAQPDPDVVNNPKYIVPSIKVELSLDNMSWEKATYVDGITIGNASGEVTLIELPEAKQARYVRLTLVGQEVMVSTGSQSLYSLRLGDVVAF